MSSHGRRPVVAVTEAERGLEPLQALARGSVEINAALTADEMLAAVGRHARAATGARQAVVSLTEEPSHSQRIMMISLDTAYERWSDYEIPPDGSGVYTVATRTGEPLRLTQQELESHPGWRAFGDEAGRHPPIRGLLAVPMIGRDGGSLGLIQLSDRAEGDFDADDEAMLVQLAQIASVAVERLRHEEALRAERDRTDAILDAMLDGVLVTGAGGVVERVSPSFRRMTGWTEGDLLGRSAPYPFWPRGAAEALPTTTAVFGDGSAELDLVFRRADGTDFPVLVSAAPVGDDGTAVTIVKDMTTRHAAERQLEESRKRLSEAQRIANLGSWDLDVATSRAQWSDEVYRILGIDRTGVVPTIDLFLDLVHPDDRDSVREAIDEALGAGERFDLEHRVVRPDGEVRVLLEQGEVELDERGRPVHFIGTMLDVTARRRAEDEAREHANRVVALAEGRGRLVADALTAEERARQALAEVLHDDVLQDLLAARQDVADAIGRRGGGGDVLDTARAGIVRATARLREVVGELHPVTLTHGGLEAALQAVAESVAKRGGFTVTFEIDRDATGVHDRLVLALAREFLVNVEKHAEAEHAHVRVERVGEDVRLTVTDDGRGFTPEADGQAFNRGHIGLPSARERVAALGGALTVRSAPGRGARIVVLIPAQPD